MYCRILNCWSLALRLLVPYKVHTDIHIAANWISVWSVQYAFLNDQLASKPIRIYLLSEDIKTRKTCPKEKKSFSVLDTALYNTTMLNVLST